MGELVLAAKVTHVPSMFISEQEGPLKGIREEAINGLKRIGELCRERQVDTIIVSDTHWLVNAGFHINAKPDMSGIFTSTEFPHFLNNMEYQHVGDPELGQLIAETATKKGVTTLCHDKVATLELQYGTLVPLRYLGIGTDIKVVSIAGWMYDAELEESKTVGEGGMHDTAMLFGILGWDNYTGKGEVMTEYFPSSGTGQCNMVFPIQEKQAAAA